MWVGWGWTWGSLFSPQRFCDLNKALWGLGCRKSRGKKCKYSTFIENDEDVSAWKAKQEDVSHFPAVPPARAPVLPAPPSQPRAKGSICAWWVWHILPVKEKPKKIRQKLQSSPQLSQLSSAGKVLGWCLLAVLHMVLFNLFVNDLESETNSQLIK